MTTIKSTKPITEQPLPPQKTVEQEDLTLASQRFINRIWEFTQAALAITITIAFLYCAINSIDTRVLDFAFASVVTMYLQRTNHSLIGGTGTKTGTR